MLSKNKTGHDIPIHKFAQHNNWHTNTLNIRLCNTVLLGLDSEPIAAHSSSQLDREPLLSSWSYAVADFIFVCSYKTFKNIVELQSGCT